MSLKNAEFFYIFYLRALSTNVHEKSHITSGLGKFCHTVACMSRLGF